MDDIARRRGRSLPHWSRPDGTYFLTFRLADAIPVEVARRHKEEFEFDLRRLEHEIGRLPSREEARSVFTERYRRAEKYLEAGHGECLLRDPQAAKIAADAIRFFDGDRYDSTLGASCSTTRTSCSQCVGIGFQRRSWVHGSRSARRGSTRSSDGAVSSGRRRDSTT